MFRSTLFERLYPFLLGAFFAVLVFAGLAFSIIPKVPALTQLFAAAINVAGIAIGFLSTMKAILLGMKSSKTVRGLRRTGRWHGVLTKIRVAIYWSFAVAMVAAVVLIIDSQLFASSAWNLTINYLALCLWGFLVGAAIGSAHLVINLLFTIVEQDDAPSTDSAPAQVVPPASPAESSGG